MVRLLSVKAIYFLRIIFCNDSSKKVLPSHKVAGFLLYEQMDESCRMPSPQVTEQGEDSLQEDQVGHDGVLQSSSCVRVD